MPASPSAPQCSRLCKCNFSEKEVNSHNYSWAGCETHLYLKTIQSRLACKLPQHNHDAPEYAEAGKCRMADLNLCEQYRTLYTHSTEGPAGGRTKALVPRLQQRRVQLAVRGEGHHELRRTCRAPLPLFYLAAVIFDSMPQPQHQAVEFSCNSAPGISIAF